MTESEIDILTQNDARLEALAAILARKLESRMTHHCQFSPGEAVAVKNLIKWGRVAIAAVIVSSVTGFMGLIISFLTR